MPLVAGHLKWFDAAKGFGFIVPDDGGSDVLLHENVLFDFGMFTALEGAEIECEVVDTTRGRQVSEIFSLDSPMVDPVSVLSDILPAETDIDALLNKCEIVPARVKWFDKTKGFGFVNAFGSHDDIFVHVEVMRAYGLGILERGGAIAVKYTDGPKGLVAIELRQWDEALPVC